MTNNCLVCNKPFAVKPCFAKKGRGKYCSKQCYWESLKGSHPEKCRTRIFVNCKQCNKSFFTYQNRIDDNRGKFCSKECLNKSKITSTRILCRICKKPFRAIPSTIKKGGGKFCSKECYGKSLIGSIRKNSKRRYTSNGYVYIKKPEHLFAKKNGYVSEHRFIYEKFLGRYLTSIEVIHHINKDKSDNRLVNLMYFENNALHIKFHRKLHLRKQ